jgi:hypothetical protein
MIFDRALTVSEIEALYNSGEPPVYSIIDTDITDDCILSYAMNNRDNSLTDESAESNDGTANGGATSDGRSLTWKVR